MAPGSHDENGNCADLVKAPTKMHPSPTVTVVPDGGEATMADNSYVPAACPTRMRPTNITRPPAPVVSSACNAEDRALGSRSAHPMRRYDVIDVSSQHT